MAKESDNPLLKIGQLAKRLGLNVRTLLYYEAIGLLAPAHRSESGYRLYSEEDERRLRFVLQAKRVGFSLEEIGQILHRTRRGGAPCGYVREALQRHIAILDERIAELQRVRAELAETDRAWQHADDGSLGDDFCSLIEGWSGDSFAATMRKDEETMATEKRQVEVFTAGCPLCDPAVQRVQRLACDDCEITVYDLREGCETNACRTKAQEYGVHRVPAVVINGKLADCCRIGPVSEETLRAAGLGAPAA